MVSDRKVKNDNLGFVKKHSKICNSIFNTIVSAKNKCSLPFQFQNESYDIFQNSKSTLKTKNKKK